MTIKELLKEGAKNIDPNEAELLLRHALGMSTLQLVSSTKREVDDADAEKFRGFVARRAKHEPVAYIIGEKGFFDLTLHVEPGVLIPRPETEMLVDLALEHLRFCKRNHIVIDIGTGSGAIAAALASKTGEKILATEFSPLAASIAKKNFAKLGFSARIELLPGNGLAPVLEKRAFKQAEEIVILANLPYIPTRDYTNLMPDVKNFEPREALDGGADGLDLYRVLLNQIEDIKKPMALYFEIDPSQSETLPEEIKKRFPDAETAVYPDLNNLNRFVTAKLNTP